MEFLKHLKNEYDTELMREAYFCCGLTEFDLPQRSKGIEFKNGLVLSIQGSSAHYCIPRQTLSYDKYTKMEFALCTVKGFADVKEYLDTDEYDQYFDGSVYSYVPVDLIEKLYQDLKAKFGIKE
jgi:hypothetical protein